MGLGHSKGGGYGGEISTSGIYTDPGDGALMIVSRVMVQRELQGGVIIPAFDLWKVEIDVLAPASLQVW